MKSKKMSAELSLKNPLLPLSNIFFRLSIKDEQILLTQTKGGTYVSFIA